MELLRDLPHDMAGVRKCFNLGYRVTVELLL